MVTQHRVLRSAKQICACLEFSEVAMLKICATAFNCLPTAPRVLEAPRTEATLHRSSKTGMVAVRSIVVVVLPTRNRLMREWP